MKQKLKKVPQKDKTFVEEILKRNMEKTIKIFKSSIPSYFNRHFKTKKEDNQSLADLDTVKRFSSPQLKRSIKSSKIYDSNILSANPIIPLLHKSNGIELYRVIDPNYKFFVSPGNNDLLIRKLLKLKPNWYKAFSPHSANLIWTDVKKSSIFDLMPKSKNITKKIVLKNSEFYNQILPADEYAALMTSATLNPLKIKVYNKLEGNSELASKKKLFINMVAYYKSINKDPFDYIPLNFHLVAGVSDANYPLFLQKFRVFEAKSKEDHLMNSVWIVKPGEATNRGIGITVCSTIEEINTCINEKKPGSINRTYIVQKYIYRPLLYYDRKFDIRCYALITIINNNIQGYFYKEGYLRTSCFKFSMNDIHDKFIHQNTENLKMGTKCLMKSFKHTSIQILTKKWTSKR